MSALGDRLVAMMTGGAGDVAGASHRELADELIRRTGSLTAAARAAGVDRRTYQRWYQRWRAGHQVRRPRTLDRLAGAVRAARIHAPSDHDVTLRTRDRDNPRRERTITGRQLRLAPGTMQRAAEVWAATGDSEQVAATFLAGVQDRFYRRYLTPVDARQPATGAGAAPAGDGDGGGGGGGGRRGEEEIVDWSVFYEYVIADYEVADYDTGYGGVVI